MTRQGTKFLLNGGDFKFVGFNLFDAANTSFYSCPQANGWGGVHVYTEAELNADLAYAKAEGGASVLRFWAFQKYTNGGTDWSGIDKVIRVAKANGYKILPVLEDGPGYCTEPGGGGNGRIPKWGWSTTDRTQPGADTWYTIGYKQTFVPYTLSYPNYVRAIVTRYKDEPTILGWMLMNEADTSRRVDSSGKSAIDGNGLTGTTQSSLVSFAQDMALLVKGIDQNHLLTVGTQSNGSSGASGKDFIDVYGIPEIDFAEVHDWQAWGSDTDPLPGSLDGKTLPDPNSPDCLKTYQAKLACSIAHSVFVIHKPIIVGEVGIAARTEAERQRRSLLIEAKIKAFFEVGGAGYLYWQLNRTVDAEGFDVQITNNDPLFGLFKKYAVGGIALPPTPIPSASPYMGATTDTTIEGESMNVLSPTQFGIYTGGPLEGLSGGKTLSIWNNGSASASFTGAAVKLVVRARSYNVAGAHMVVKIDGVTVLNTLVTVANQFSAYTASFTALSEGEHIVTIIFDNDDWNPGCSCTPDLGIDNIVVSVPTSSSVPLKIGDIDKTGKVDIFDYNLLLTNFGKKGTGVMGDLDENGMVDIFDYNTLLSNFGK